MESRGDDVGSIIEASRGVGSWKTRLVLSLNFPRPPSVSTIWRLPLVLKSSEMSVILGSSSGAANSLDTLPSDLLEYKITKSLPLGYCISLGCVSKRLHRIVSKIVATKKRALSREYMTISNIMLPAVADGAVNLVAWLVTDLKFTDLRINTSILEAASAAGHIEIVRWCMSNQPSEAPSEVCWTHASFQGHLRLLKFFLENDSSKKSYLEYSSGVMAAAARGGHSEILRWGRSIGLAWDGDVTDLLAARGSLEDLRWAVSLGCPVSTHITEFAAKGGHIEVLQFLVGKGCYWTERTCASACRANQSRVIEWLKQNRCPWDYCKKNALMHTTPQEKKQKRKST